MVRGIEHVMVRSLWRISLILLVWIVFLWSSVHASEGDSFSALFGYRAMEQNGLDHLPQWLSVLERHLLEDVPEGDCSEGFLTTCHLRRWFEFLESVRGLPREEQIFQVNRYVNKKEYVLDLNNYGREDYWAIAREFLYNGGDCEDYAITKFFSLKWLGYSPDEIRIVVLQDTNLRTPHAVLAVSRGRDAVILDNQSGETRSHSRIVHYIPLFSLNEKSWWLYLPPGISLPNGGKSL